MIASNVVDERLPGIQLALFELVWPAFEWIDSIYVGNDESTCFVYVQVSAMRDKDEWGACVRLLGEIFAAALAGTRLRLEVSRGLGVPSGSGYREAISGAVFKLIAKEVAPWRLEAGR